MATATITTCDGAITVPLDKIYVPANVRELDLDHVDALAGSIGLQGQLVPVLVALADGEAAERGFEYELIAGFHRYAAVAKLQHGALDAILRAPDDENDAAAVAAARATENIASCRRRHETINADRAGMPTNMHVDEWRWTSGRDDIGIATFNDERRDIAD